MAPAQIGAIALCIVINMMDGFEIFVPSFTAAWPGGTGNSSAVALAAALQGSIGVGRKPVAANTLLSRGPEPLHVWSSG